MPCMCWYQPEDKEKKYLKDLCQQIVDKIKELEHYGDPYDCRIDDMKKLLDHLYRPETCKEKGK